MTRRKLKCVAPAKINLFLEILGKRPDGYHELQTIFSKILLSDSLNFVLTKNSSVKILTDTDSLKQEDNLVYKVAVFIKKKYNVKYGVEIELKKNIPIAAGLGGGSSDAATTIMALNFLWQLNLTSKEQAKIASEWGSDINFFLNGYTALGEGRGEKITPLPSLLYENIVLVNPLFGISSAEAYQLVKPDYKPLDYKEFLANPQPKFCANRLEAGIRYKYPLIDKLIKDMESSGAEKAILSGSGATVIGFCPNQETAQKLCQYYSNKGYWSIITKTKGEQNEHYRC